MADPITAQQLQDASTDADNIALVANGDENTVVTMRLGRKAPTIAKALADLNAPAHSTWAELSGIVPTINARAQVLTATDAGNHADPVTGVNVANAGFYRGVANPTAGQPNVWTWVGASQTDQAAGYAATSYHLANDSTDVPIPGYADNTARGAKWWSIVAQTAAAMLSGLINAFDLTDSKIVNLLFGVESADGYMPFAVNDDGTTDIAALRSPDIVTAKIATGRMIIQDGAANLAGELTYVADVPDLDFGIQSADGYLSFARNADASTDMVWDRAARYSDSVLVDPNGFAVLEARPYAVDRRHVYIYWLKGQNGGKTIKLTSDDTADHSITGFDNTSGVVGIQKRIGDFIEHLSVDGTIGGAPLFPLKSSTDILLDGDSFAQPQLVTVMQTAAINKHRQWYFSGSGGSWLTSHLAALGGPRVPNGVGADGGVVDADQVGTLATRSGGTAQASVTGSISGNVLTVTGILSGTVVAGQKVKVVSNALTVTLAPIIQAFGSGGTTGSGGVGTYQLNVAPGNVASQTIYLGSWTYPGLPLAQRSTVVVMDGGIDDLSPNQATTTGSISGNNLTVASGTNIAIGQYVMGTGVEDGTWITGGSGVNWQVNISQTVASTALSLSDPAIAIATSLARIQAFDKIMTPLVRRWFYVQPGIKSDSTPSQVGFYKAYCAIIAASIGWHYISTYDYMRANGTGSTVGSNGGQVWPANEYGDTLHPSTEGQGLLGTRIINYVESLGG